MTGQLDPYHVWLGIPPAEQPPNRYRLLGLPLFEGDPNVIANGADRQMAHLKSFGTSKHANLAQRLLNECAAAKVCLLKPEKKAAYDNTLRAQLAVQQPPLPPTSGAAGGAFPTVAPAVRRPPPVVRSRGKNQSGVWIASGIGGLVVIVGLVAALIFANSKDDESSATNVARATSGERDIKTEVPQTKTDDGKPKVDPVVSPNTPNTIAKTNDDTIVPNGKSPPDQEIDAAPPTTGDSSANTSAAARSPTAPKFPVVAMPDRDAKPFDGMTSVAGWQTPNLPTEPIRIGSAEAGKLRPGLILLRYPRQAIQQQQPGAFVLPNRLGSSLGAPTLARGMARFYFPTNENVLAVGYLRINEAGQYSIGGGNRFGRDTVYLLGEPVVRYSNRPGTRYSRRNLEPGYYPIAVAGFADSDGHAGVNVSRRGAGSGGSSVRLGDAIFYHDPNFASSPAPNPFVPAAAGQFNVQRDAFSQVDIARHVVGGNWTRTGNQLSGVTEGVYGRVQVPVEVPPEYDFSFRATRSNGDGPLVIGVPYKGRLIGIGIDEWNENGVGLLQFDRKKTAGAVTFPQPSLRVGQTAQVVINIREWGVQVQIDGFIVFRSRITTEEHHIQGNWVWEVPKMDQPFVGMHQAGFSLESLVIQPVGQPAVSNAPTTIANTNPVTTPNTTPEQRNVTSFETHKAVPDAEKQAEVEKQVREVFAKDFAAVKKPADRATLAGTLLRHAQETKDDPAATYMLLLLAKNTAAEAGEATLALRAVDQMVEDYQVEATAEKIVALSKLATTAHQGPQVKMVIDAASDLGQDLIAQDKYEEAVKAFTAARNMAGKAKESDLAKGLTQRIKDIAPLENQYKTVREALKKLEANEDDADANVVVGRWHWFVKNRPDKAMQYFAKAGDGDLKNAAAIELENPSDAKAHLAVADAWDQLSAKRRGPDKQPFELRAFHWFLKASASAQGLDKAKADKRVEEMRSAIEKRLLTDAGKAGSAPPELKGVLSPGVVVEYFSDQQLGNRMLMKVVESVRTNALHRNETKMAPTGLFSARWTGWLIPPKAGTYKIVFNYRAGLYIDGKPVVAPRQTKTDVVVELSARPHHIRYEAPNMGWGSVPRFEWQSEEETATRPITPEFLFHVPLPGEAPAELPVVRPRL